MLSPTSLPPEAPDWSAQVRVPLTSAGYTPPGRSSCVCKETNQHVHSTQKRWHKLPAHTLACVLRWNPIHPNAAHGDG